MTEFDEELDKLVSDLEGRDPSGFGFAWPRERPVIDTYNTIGFIEGEGLYGFWSGDLNQRRIIRSFRKIGATRLAELLEESRWARRLVRTGDYDERKRDFGADRMREFDALENKILASVDGAADKIRRYVETHAITVKPLGLPGVVCAWIAALLEMIGVVLKSFGEVFSDPKYRK